jgi:hypothetical protein
MSALAFSQLINQMPLEIAGTMVGPTPVLMPPEAARRQPELAGTFARIPGHRALYIIDRQGYRRLIPFPLTFIHLFKDSCALQGVLLTASVANIAEGPSLDDGAILMRGASSERIYLLDHGCKRLITGRGVMEKYGFNEAAVVAIRQVVVDAVPTGEIWE